MKSAVESYQLASLTNSTSTNASTSSDEYTQVINSNLINACRMLDYIGEDFQVLLLLPPEPKWSNTKLTWNTSETYDRFKSATISAYIALIRLSN